MMQKKIALNDNVKEISSYAFKDSNVEEIVLKVAYSTPISIAVNADKQSAVITVGDVGTYTFKTIHKDKSY